MGVEISISALVGKWKTNQNRPEADQRGVIPWLEAHVSGQSKAMADWVRSAAF